MIHAKVTRGDGPAVSGDLVSAAARCWRWSRDSGAAVQRELHRLLSSHGQDMLAPAFDSLMTFYEDALGRRVIVGRTNEFSEDEKLLIQLLAGSRQRSACIECKEGAASTLDCAICSIRIMMGFGRQGS